MKLKKMYAAFALGLVLSVSTIGGVAQARDGADDSTEVTTSSTEQSETAKKDAEARREAAKQAQEQVREKAKQDFEKKREAAKQKVETESEKEKHNQERTKTCESKKQGLDQKFSRLSANAQKFNNHIDEVLKKAEAYKTEKNLTVDNYDALVAAAVAADAKSQASVSALSALKPTLDCNKDSVASDVSTFKAAAEQARTDLKDYRTSVKALLKAIEQAKELQSEGQEGQQ